MTTIYSITQWDDNMKQVNSKLFMTLEGVAKWLSKESLIGSQFNVRDKEIAGDYDITADNLRTILAASKKQGVAASFTIKEDFVFQIFNTQYTLTTVNVED